MKDMISMLYLSSTKTEAPQVRRILQGKWGLTLEKTTYYKAYFYGSDDDIQERMKSARIFRVSKQKLNELLLES